MCMPMPNIFYAAILLCGRVVLPYLLVLQLDGKGYHAAPCNCYDECSLHAITFDYYSTNHHREAC